MTLKLGTLDIDAYFLGDTALDKAYLGTNEVYAPETGTLYAIGNNTLHTLDISSPPAITATTIGSQFNTSLVSLASHAGILYSTSRDTLYTVNATTGAFTRIGRATAFGVSESNAGGLASHNGVLYMAGSSNDALYTVDTSTGVATKVGTSNRFNANVRTPTGLTSLKGVLYMVGRTQDALFTVNPITGEADKVDDNTRRFDASVRSPASLGAYLGTLYLSDSDRLYSVTTDTGIATLVGNLPYTMTGLTSHVA